MAALGAPVLCLLLDAMQGRIFATYRIGLEMLLINAAVTYALLWLAARVRAASA